MSEHLSRALRGVATGLGLLTILGALALLVLDLIPRNLGNGTHDWLAAVALALAAIAYLVCQGTRRVTPQDWTRAWILAVAFLFWAANQISADQLAARLFNDAAIAGFVLDLFLSVLGWPPHATFNPLSPERRVDEVPSGRADGAGRFS